MQIRKILLIPFIGICTLTCCACQDNELESFERIDNHYGYSTDVMSIDSMGGYNASVSGKGVSNDTIYISVNYYPDSEGDIIQKLFSIDNATVNEISNLEYCNGSFNNYQTCIDDNWVEVSDLNEVIFYSLQDGSISRTLTYEDELPIIAVESCSDGFVLLEQGRISKCNEDGSVVSSYENEQFVQYCPDCPFYEDGDASYVLVSENVTDWAYYEIDFDAGEATRIMSSRDISNSVRYSGQYIIDYNGECKVDLQSMKSYDLAQWNDIDVQPARKSLSNTEEYLAFDDTHFAVYYEYTDGSIDIVYLTYDPTIDFSSIEKIVVGGYGVNNDLLLKWAVYAYNTSQNDYRVVLDDYVNDYGYTTGEEAQSKTAALIQYINSGGAPDIYYGNNFDYKSLSRSGLTQDIFPYLSSDLEFDSDSLSQSVKDIVFADNRCDYLFSAYVMNGYVGLSEYFEADNSVSISELSQLGYEKSITPISKLNTENIVDYTIRYAMWNLIDDEGKLQLTNSQLEEVVTFADRYGIGHSELVNEYCDLYSLSRHEYLLSLGYWGDFVSFATDVVQYDEEYSYIGYPSIYGSVHTFNPYGQVAMSSSTNKPDVCWDFIKCLFSEDIQVVALVNGMVPVNRNVIDELAYFINNPNDSNQNEVIRSYILYGMRNQTIPEGTIEKYIEFVNTIDTPVTYDWGVYNIICEEVYSYEVQGKPLSEVVESMKSRLNIYVDENY